MITVKEINISLETDWHTDQYTMVTTGHVFTLNKHGMHQTSVSPSLHRSRTMLPYELRSAVCLGVFPYSSVMLMSAPWRSKVLTHSPCLLLTAKWRGV